MTRKIRIPVSVMLQLLVLLPVIIPAAVSCLLQDMARAIDFLMKGRWLTEKCMRASDRICRWGWQ